jgi:hypothetical protein
MPKVKQALALLRARRQRPRRRRAAEQRDELASFHRAGPKPKDQIALVSVYLGLTR